MLIVLLFYAHMQRDVIQELDNFSPAYKLFPSTLGFHGRPGHRAMQEPNTSTLSESAPWTDSISDMRAAMSLLFLYTSSLNSQEDDGLKEVYTQLLDDADVRVRYFASRFLLRRYVRDKPVEYRKALRRFVAQAQQMNDERLVDNPYLQIKHIMESGLQSCD